MMVLHNVDPVRRTVAFGSPDATLAASTAIAECVARMREFGIDWLSSQDPGSDPAYLHAWEAGDGWVQYHLQVPVADLVRSQIAFYSAATLTTAGWIPIEDLMSLHLAIYELVANVIDHGCPLDDSSVLTLTLRLDQQGASVSIHDGCAPFVPEDRAVEAVLDRARTKAPRGYGVTLVARAVDRVEYDFGPLGNGIRLEKGVSA